MIVTNNLGQTIAAHSPNNILIEGVVGELVVNVTVNTDTTDTYEMRFCPSSGRLVLELEEICKLVYCNVPGYSDPYGYDQDFTFSELDNYHFMKFSLDIADDLDTTQPTLNFNVVNAALQVCDGTVMDDYLNVTLDQFMCDATPIPAIDPGLYQSQYENQYE